MIIVSGNLILFIIWCSFLRIFFLTLVSSSLSLLFYFVLKVEQKCILKWLWCYLICCLLLCSMHNKRNKIIVSDCFFIRRPTMKKLLLRTLNGVVKSQGSYFKKKLGVWMGDDEVRKLTPIFVSPSLCTGVEDWLGLCGYWNIKLVTINSHQFFFSLNNVLFVWMWVKFFKSECDR